MKPLDTSKHFTTSAAIPTFEKALHVGSPNVGSRKKFLSHVEDIFNENWLTNNGPKVREFEQKIADYHKVKHCIAMCNGTVALEIAIRALKLEGEVIVPSYTFVATAHALHWQAITPVFADIDPDTHNLSPSAVRSMITPRTTGIIGVHLWGRVSPIDELQNIADEYNLKLLFDAAHAFGCSYKGQRVGSFGECEVLSFHATKVLNAFEGGAILTNNDKLAEAMRLMRNFGFSGMDSVIHPGTNGKMIEIAAAMGLVNLDAIADIIEANKNNYHVYKKALSTLSHIKLLDFDTVEHNNYQYVVIKIDKECPVTRDEIITALHAENVLARRYFWPGCHKMKPYCDLYPHAGLLLPNTEDTASQVIVLPTGVNINNKTIKVIVSIIKSTLDNKA